MSIDNSSVISRGIEHGKNIGLDEVCVDFDRSKPIVFLVHGFISNANYSEGYELSKALVKVGVMLAHRILKILHQRLIKEAFNYAAKDDNDLIIILRYYFLRHVMRLNTSINTRSIHRVTL